LECRRLGRTGLKIPTMGVGTWLRFDVPPEGEEDIGRVVRSALDHGIRFFDSSPMYGRAEAVLGRALGSRREEAIVGTKVWTYGLAGEQAVFEGRFQFEAQLAHYGGFIDVMQVHNLAAYQDHLPWLEEERNAGRIGWIGGTHYRTDALTALVPLMDAGRLDVIGVPYNPLEAEAADMILPLAEEQDIGVIAMRPFAEGELLPGPDIKRLDGLGVETWAEALLKWTLSDGRIHVVIPATRQEPHLLANVQAAQPPWFDPDQRAFVGRLAAKYAGASGVG